MTTKKLHPHHVALNSLIDKVLAHRPKEAAKRAAKRRAKKTEPQSLPAKPSKRSK
jgi:hypothetical protein